MAFTVVTTEDAQTLSRDFRSITGAKRHVADALITRIGGICADDSLWSGRTHGLQRERVMKALSLVQATLEYSGPTRLEFEGVEYVIDHDADVPTRATVKRERKLKQRTKVLTVRFEGDCGGCGSRILAGAEALYDYQERKVYCPGACADAHLAAIAPKAVAA